MVKVPSKNIIFHRTQLYWTDTCVQINNICMKIWKRPWNIIKIDFNLCWIHKILFTFYNEFIEIIFAIPKKYFICLVAIPKKCSAIPISKQGVRSGGDVGITGTYT